MGPGPALPDAIPEVASVSRVRTGECVHVYRATRSGTGEQARLFILAPDAPAAAESVFERATADWDRCSDHPGIVTVHARGDTPQPWLVAADIDGHRLSETTLPRRLQIQVLGDAAEAVRVAHREGDAHLGLTPERIWVDTGREYESGYDEETDRNELVDPTAVTTTVDWDLEWACGLTSGDASGPTVPPERESDREAINTSVRADIYRLGVVAFETLTGETPTETRAATAVDPSLPETVDDVLARALAPDPVDRYESAYAFKRALVFDIGAALPAESGNDSGSTGTDPGGSADSEPDGDEAESEEGSESDTDTAGRFSRRTLLAGLGLGTVGAGGGGGLLFTTIAGNEAAATPDVDFGFTLRPRSVAVTYEGGDELRADEVVIRSDALPAGDRVWSETGDRAETGDRPVVESGETVRLDVEGDGGYEVQLVRTTDDEQVLTSQEGPLDPQDPAIGDVTTPQYTVGNTGFRPATAPSPGANERWRFDADDRIDSSPAVVDGVLYVGSDDGTVQAVDADTGLELWATATGARVRASPSAGPLPEVTGDGRGATQVFVGNAAGQLLALHARDGSVEWERSLGDGPVQSPAVVQLGTDDGSLDKTVVFAGGANRIAAFDARNGTELWSVEMETQVTAPAAVVTPGSWSRSRTTVFAGAQSEGVFAVDAHTGARVWETTVSGVGTAPTVVRSPRGGDRSGGDRIVYDVIVGRTGQGTRGVASLAVDGGNILWTTETAGDVTASPAAVRDGFAAAAGGTVFAGDRSGAVYALDASEGSLRWESSVDAPVDSPPMVVETGDTEWHDGQGNTLFFGSWNGNIYGFTTDSGDGRWAFTTGAPVGTAPVVVDGTLYAGNHDGQLYALEETQRDELDSND